jgi:hypothetical protein
MRNHPHLFTNIKNNKKQMSCILSTGYTIGCKTQAGVQKVFIGSWNDTSLTYTLGTNSIITGFGGATTSFYTFQQPIETSSFTAPAEVNTENNAIQYNQTLSITVQGMNAALLNQIKILGQGVWRVLILDKNGAYFLMGKSGPVQVSAIEAGLGKAGTDLSGATITFTAKEDQALSEVESAAALTLITA